MIQKANNAIAKGANGKWNIFRWLRGYVTFRFDHILYKMVKAPILKFRQYFAGSSEPGIIMVAFDKNKMENQMMMNGMK